MCPSCDIWDRVSVFAWFLVSTLCVCGSLGRLHWFAVTMRVLIMSLLYLVIALAGLSAGRKRPISQSKVKSIADLALRNQGEYKMVVYEVSIVV
jgi:hypothetical protein